MDWILDTEELLFLKAYRVSTEAIILIAETIHKVGIQCIIDFDVESWYFKFRQKLKKYWGIICTFAELQNF